MSYDNTTEVATSVTWYPTSTTSSGEWDCTDPTAPVFYYTDIAGIFNEDIPIADQIIVTRIFSQGLKSEGIDGFAVSSADRREMFIIPKSNVEVDEANNKITIDLTGIPDYHTEAGDDIEIPTFTINADTVTIARKTHSLASFVDWAPGTRKTFKQLNLENAQILNLIQEVLHTIKSELVHKDDQYASDGVFVGGTELDMADFKVINLGDPGLPQDGANKRYVLRRLLATAMLAKDDSPADLDADSDTDWFNDTSPWDSSTPCWFNPKTGGLYIYIDDQWVRIMGLNSAPPENHVIGVLDASGNFDSSKASSNSFNSNRTAKAGTWFVITYSPVSSPTITAACNTSTPFTGGANLMFHAVKVGDPWQVA